MTLKKSSPKTPAHLWILRHLQRDINTLTDRSGASAFFYSKITEFMLIICCQLEEIPLTPQELQTVLAELQKMLDSLLARKASGLDLEDLYNPDAILRGAIESLAAELAANTFYLKAGDWVFFVTPDGNIPIGSLEAPIKVIEVTGDKFVGTETIMKVDPKNDDLAAISFNLGINDCWQNVRRVDYVRQPDSDVLAPRASRLTDPYPEPAPANSGC